MAGVSWEETSGDEEDGYRHSEYDVEVDGDTITVKYMSDGELPDFDIRSKEEIVAVLNERAGKLRQELMDLDAAREAAEKATTVRAFQALWGDGCWEEVESYDDEDGETEVE